MARPKQKSFKFGGAKRRKSGPPRPKAARLTAELAEGTAAFRKPAGPRTNTFARSARLKKYAASSRGSGGGSIKA